MAGVEMQITITDCDLRGRWNEVPITFEMYGIERHVLAPTKRADRFGRASARLRVAAIAVIHRAARSAG
jgi:hypothetical protein